MKFEINYIEKLAKLINDNGLSEISLKDGEQAVTVKKEGGCVPVIQPLVENRVVTEKTDNKEIEHKGKPITAPMVGTFYSTMSKGAEPLVTVGKTISSGDVVCVIEAMKLMNEIESEYTGTITEICVANGEPVEYGQILMYVE